MGDEEFAAFYMASKERCLRAAMAYGMAPQSAEDAVAEAYSRAWARWSHVRELHAPSAWVVRTAINANISWWRQRRREASPVNDVTEQAETRLRDIDADTDLHAAIRGLPPRQREVVVLRYLLDLDTEATARSLEIAPGTVTATLHRALASLRKNLQCKEETVS